MAISTINQAGLNAPLTLTSPVLTTPNLGTPSAINLSNATSLPRTAMPSGSVIQTVYATAAGFSTTSTSNVATGLTATITPTSASNHILISVAWPACYIVNNNTELLGSLYKNGSLFSSYMFDGYITTAALLFTATGFIRDTPGTTSATTYAMYLQSSTGNLVYTGASGQSQKMILMEIAA